MRERTFSDQSMHCFTPQINRMKGQVIRIQEGVNGWTLKLRVGKALDLKVRSACSSVGSTPFCPGQWLEADIPPEDIYLMSPEVALARARWTRWGGRIVLASPSGHDSCLSGLTTVKVRNESLTLRSQRALGGTRAPRQVGDRVVLLIDPRAVAIRSVESTVNVASSFHRGSGPDSFSPFQPKRVRLPATIIRTRQATVGVFVTLRIGQAVVSAHVTGEGAHVDLWPVGRATALIVGQQEAWIQSFGMPMTSCRLVDLASDDQISRRPLLHSFAPDRSFEI